jgi:hypothetical protein
MLEEVYPWKNRVTECKIGALMHKLAECAVPLLGEGQKGEAYLRLL